MFTLHAARLTANAAKKTVLVFAESKGKLTNAGQMVDESLGGFIRKSVRQSRYQGGLGEVFNLTPSAGAISRVMLLGTGRQASLGRKEWFSLGLTAGKLLDASGVAEATVALGELESSTLTVSAASALVEGVAMALYRFDDYKSEMKEHSQPRFEKLTILTTTRSAHAIEAEAPKLAKLIAATETTRNAANQPPNVANPEYLANEARKLEKLGIKVQVIDEKEMKKLGMNLFLAVGGSAAPEDQPRMVIMHYNGGPKNQKPTAIVGKGICYDTGGYNIKTGGYMAGMKFDMSGAAAVLGAMQSLASRKAKVNVVGVMACAMNMIGQTPFVPDSIYKSYKGLFVEIGNTDAEGRLVLADAIAYTIEKFEPTQLVDLATLTGAIMVALGSAYGGLFSTSNALANALAKSGEETGERLWRMPVDDCFKAKAKVADVNNDGSPYGGSSVAANFIKNFVGKTPWAHLDVAGVTNPDKAPGMHSAFTGATGYGVRLLTHWLENNLAEPEQGEAPRKRRGRPPLASKAAAATATAKRGRGRPRKTA
ncbi:MAG: leucyl aminopeptidase [Proteobacteria bacterium]|nr:leucyl aminopeptidase [Pseudomonadota bacterium]